MNLPVSKPEFDSLGIDLERVPRHVAIIMDGNGRWATARNLPRALGHRQGVLALKPIVKAAAAVGIEVLTVYAFSTENWVRPTAEVDALMDLLMEFLRSETQELKAEGVMIRTIGDISALPDRAREALAWAKETTAEETRMILNLALNYGGRDEIVRAVNRWLSHSQAGDAKQAERLTERELAVNLDTQGLPDPDLLIRSSGEERISNFMLWQIAYTEIYVTKTLWPDFRPTTLFEAIADFQKRARRFGAIQ